MRVLAVLGVFLMVLFVSSGIWAQSSVSNAPEPPPLFKPGQPAPPFRSRDLQGTPVALHDYQGRPVIVNFWATWCAPCRQEMRTLQTTYEVYKTAGLEILAVSQDQAEHTELVRTYWRSMALTFKPLLDPEGSVATHYSVVMLPSTVFIHPSGTVTAVHLGPLNQTQIERYLQAIMPRAS